MVCPTRPIILVIAALAVAGLVVACAPTPQPLAAPPADTRSSGPAPSVAGNSAEPVTTNGPTPSPLVAASGEAPAPPADPRSSGTVKIHDGNSENSGNANDPKVCTFHIHFFLGRNTSGTFHVETQPGSTVVLQGAWDSGSADQVRVPPYPDVYELPNGQYKLYWEQVGAPGGAKQKVFKVDCPAPSSTPSAAPTTSASPSSTPVPTASPTPSPTATPTATPSDAPTATPSDAPTPEPSSSPPGGGVDPEETERPTTSPGGGTGPAETTRPGQPDTSTVRAHPVTTPPPAVPLSLLVIAALAGAIGYRRSAPPR